MYIIHTHTWQILASLYTIFISSQIDFMAKGTVRKEEAYNIMLRLISLEAIIISNLGTRNMVPVHNDSGRFSQASQELTAV